ncbi:MAG: GNAT family N-acetyltransferase, partial [Stellaceae bacterium]
PAVSAGDGIEIGTASERDLVGILALQEANQPERGGTLSARLDRAQFEAMLADLPLIVARRGAAIVGYLLAASTETVAEVPVIRAMLAAYPGGPGAYVYGPIVVAEAERGHGLAQRLFESLRMRLPSREGILFIRADNPASLRAHEKMGVVSRGTFRHNERDFVVLSYQG